MKQSQLQSQKILVIDGDMASRIIYKYYLNTLGYNNIDFSPNAEHALRKDLSKYTLIFSDFYFGNDLLTGYEFSLIVKKQLCLNVPIVINTKIKHSLIFSAITEKLIQGFLSKPFSLKEIKTILRKVNSAHLRVVFINPEAYLPSWVRLISDIIKGAGFSYSRVACHIHVSPRYIRKLLLNHSLKPKFRVYDAILRLHYQVFQGPVATQRSKEYWEKKYLKNTIIPENNEENPEKD